MTSKSYHKCEDLMRSAVKDGFTRQISKHWLRVLIKRDIGGDPRTVRNWIQNLVDFGFLKRLNASVFEMDLRRVEGALELAVKGDNSQKRLM